MIPKRYLYVKNGGEKKKLAKVGMRVQVVEGSGPDSGKIGRISNRSLKDTPGWYASITPDRWVTLEMEDGTFEAMLFVRLRIVDEDEVGKPTPDALKSIPRRTFTENDFMPTDFVTAAEKAAFANKFQAFILNGCPETQFNKPLYRILSTYMWGHIAHYDLHGFFATWFSDASQRFEFLRNAAAGGFYGPCGDPAHTWVDVEIKLSHWVRTSGVLNVYEARRDREANLRAFSVTKKLLPLLTDEQKADLLNTA